MDPNANRTESLELARKVRAVLTAGPTDDASLLLSTLEDAIRLTELVEELDVWLRQGGFLPKEWDVSGNQQGRKEDVPVLHQQHRTGGPCTAFVTVRTKTEVKGVPCALDQGHHGQCVPKEVNG